jgi:hypothetical protein
MVKILEACFAKTSLDGFIIGSTLGSPAITNALQALEQPALRLLL